MTCIVPIRLALRKARWISRTSFGSSSTSRVVGCDRSLTACFFLLANGWRLVQLDPEAAALARRRLHPNTSAHPLGGPSDDREADAGAGILLDAMQALEDPENTIVVFGRNAQTG